MILRKLTSVCVFLFGIIDGVDAMAWGNEGHQIVGLIAERSLTDTAKRKVQQLLALEPGATLESISTWADEHRSPATAAWHYVNLPNGDCHYDATRDCSDGRCVVSAIERQILIYRTNASKRPANPH